MHLAIAVPGKKWLKESNIKRPNWSIFHYQNPGESEQNKTFIYFEHQRDFFKVSFSQVSIVIANSL